MDNQFVPDQNQGQQGYTQQPAKKPVNKTVIIVIIVAAIAICAFFTYRTFFAKTKIDLGENIKVTFSGSVDEGRVSRITNNVDYDSSKAELVNFVKSVTYTYDTSKNGELKNGDKLLITANYNQSNADALKLDITNNKKTVTVSGLPHRYAKASDIPTNVINLFNNEVHAKIRSRYTSYYSNYTVTRDSIWFAKAKTSGSFSDYPDDLIYVYKTSYTSYYSNTPTTYYYFYRAHCASNFAASSTYRSYASYSLYYNNSYQINASDVGNALNQRYNNTGNDYTLTKLK